MIRHKAKALASTTGVFSLALFLTGASATTAQQERMTVETWSSPSSPDDYPERQNGRLRHLFEERPSFGISFSGGGTRSASATWGALRGLTNTGLVDNAQYISAVSGGAWAAVPYTFFDEKLEDPGCLEGFDFFTRYRTPDQLTRDDLKSEECSYVIALSKTRLAALYLSRLFAGRHDETYSRAVGCRFLDPIGKYNSWNKDQKHPKHKHFVLDSHQAESILSRGVEGLDINDFLWPSARRPFLVVGSSMLARKRFAGRRWSLFPVEITPLYTGIPQALETKKGRPIGGGFFESPAIDADRYEFHKCSNGAGTCVTTSRRLMQKKPNINANRFTVSDALGSSGAAPVLSLRRLGLNLFGFPEFKTTAISQPNNGESTEYAFGDGGHIDNLGVIPLLSRRVEKILVFVNSGKPFFRNKKLEEPKRGQLKKLFEQRWEQEPKGKVAKQKGNEVSILEPKGWDLIVERYADLKREGLPLVACSQFSTVANKRYGIPAYDPQICFVFLDRSEKWINSLPQSEPLVSKLRSKNRLPFRTFHRFPHYGTFFHRAWKGRIIDLSEEQVNALAQLTSWTVVESGPAVSRCLGLDEGRIADGIASDIAAVNLCS